MAPSSSGGAPMLPQEVRDAIAGLPLGDQNVFTYIALYNSSASPASASNASLGTACSSPRLSRQPDSAPSSPSARASSSAKKRGGSRSKNAGSATALAAASTSNSVGTVEYHDPSLLCECTPCFIEFLRQFGESPNSELMHNALALNDSIQEATVAAAAATKRTPWKRRVGGGGRSRGKEKSGGGGGRGSPSTPREPDLAAAEDEEDSDRKKKAVKPRSKQVAPSPDAHEEERKGDLEQRQVQIDETPPPSSSSGAAEQEAGERTASWFDFLASFFRRLRRFVSGERKARDQRLSESYEQSPC